MPACSENHQQTTHPLEGLELCSQRQEPFNNTPFELTQRTTRLNLLRNIKTPEEHPLDLTELAKTVFIHPKMSCQLRDILTLPSVKKLTATLLLNVIDLLETRKQIDSPKLKLEDLVIKLQEILQGQLIQHRRMNKEDGQTYIQLLTLQFQQQPEQEHINQRLRYNDTLLHQLHEKQSLELRLTNLSLNHELHNQLIMTPINARQRASLVQFLENQKKTSGQLPQQLQDFQDMVKMAILRHPKMDEYLGNQLEPMRLERIKLSYLINLLDHLNDQQQPNYPTLRLEEMVLWVQQQLHEPLEITDPLIEIYLRLAQELQTQLAEQLSQAQYGLGDLSELEEDLTQNDTLALADMGIAIKHHLTIQQQHLNILQILLQKKLAQNTNPPKVLEQLQSSRALAEKLKNSKTEYQQRQLLLAHMLHAHNHASLMKPTFSVPLNQTFLEQLQQPTDEKIKPSKIALPSEKDDQSVQDPNLSPQALNFVALDKDEDEDTINHQLQLTRQQAQQLQDQIDQLAEQKNDLRTLMQVLQDKLTHQINQDAYFNPIETVTLPPLELAQLLILQNIVANIQDKDPAFCHADIIMQTLQKRVLNQLRLPQALKQLQQLDLDLAQLLTCVAILEGDTQVSKIPQNKNQANALWEILKQQIMELKTQSYIQADLDVVNRQPTPIFNKAKNSSENIEQQVDELHFHLQIVKELEGLHFQELRIKLPVIIDTIIQEQLNQFQQNLLDAILLHGIETSKGNQMRQQAFFTEIDGFTRTIACNIINSIQSVYNALSADDLQWRLSINEDSAAIEAQVSDGTIIKLARQSLNKQLQHIVKKTPLNQQHIDELTKALAHERDCLAIILNERYDLTTSLAYHLIHATHAYFYGLMKPNQPKTIMQSTLRTQHPSMFFAASTHGDKYPIADGCAVGSSCKPTCDTICNQQAQLLETTNHQPSHIASN